MVEAHAHAKSYEGEYNSRNFDCEGLCSSQRGAALIHTQLTQVMMCHTSFCFPPEAHFLVSSHTNQCIHVLFVRAIEGYRMVSVI